MKVTQRGLQGLLGHVFMQQQHRVCGLECGDLKEPRTGGLSALLYVGKTRQEVTSRDMSTH